MGVLYSLTVFRAGDFLRYQVEITLNKDHRLLHEKRCVEYYQQSMKLSHQHLPSTHPLRLSISLNYSVCLYEVQREKRIACEIAKSAFDSAIQKLDDLDEHAYKDATLIMQLLRDNLT